MQAAIKTKIKKKVKIDIEQLPTNTLSSGNRIQRWANFVAGFSIEFVENCLKNRTSEEDIVIDPFLGCGTTLIGARNYGFKGVGVEAHPLFFNLSKCKLENYCTEDVNQVKTLLQAKNKKIEWSQSALDFINKMFDKDDIELIQYASYHINSVPEKLRPLAVVIFLNACELSCSAQTDGIYKAPNTKKKTIPFNIALENTISFILEDIESEWYKSHWQHQNTSQLYLKSSESLAEIENETLGICITSPPYLNNFDYAEMTRLQLYLLGWADSWGDISIKIRNHLITNTTTALKGKKDQNHQNICKSEIPKELNNELSQIVLDLREQRSQRNGKKEYDFLVYPYYSQIFSVLSELYKKLKKGGEVHWVVADAALYGVHIKTHEHTKILMKKAGFRDIEIKCMRKRGHRWILSKRDGTKNGLGEYHLTAKK